VKYYNLEKQILAWLNKNAIRAIAILGRKGRSVVYRVASGVKGCCFVPTLTMVFATSSTGSSTEVSKKKETEYEVVRFSDRTSFMIKHLKRPGKGGRTIKICNLYIGLQERSDGYELGTAFGCHNSFNRIIRPATRVGSAWQHEVVLRGDWDMETIAMINTAIAKRCCKQIARIEF
jgi:hypothetical protein